MGNPIMELQYQKTFDELQRMHDTDLQALGDVVLPWAYPALNGLKTQGINIEGKSRKGVPDAYVGDEPSTCRAAVEYTTQVDGLQRLRRPSGRAPLSRRRRA
jgi:hypothetical protein